MTRMTNCVFVLLIALFMMTGCATQQRVPSDEIRERAGRALDDLRAEETGGKPAPREREEERVRPSAPAVEEQGDTVRVQKGKRPDWVDGESMQYPSSHYLTGVGFDADRKFAEDKARAEISKIFLSKIDSKTRSYEEYLQTTTKGKAKTEQAISIQDITKVSTQKVLSGVRIAHVYQETGQNPLHYALAVLDRDQSARILTNRIHEVDREIDGLMRKAGAEGDMLIKIKYLTQSIEKHILREAYDAELRIVSNSGSGIYAPIHFGKIKAKLGSMLLRDFLIGVSVTVDRAGEIREALVQGFNEQGFSISEDLGRTHVLVKGTVEIEALDRGTSEWKYVRWRTHFDMVDKKGGAVFGSVSKAGREGHLNLPQAENRAVQKIQKALTTEIAQKMKDYIFSQ